MGTIIEFNGEDFDLSELETSDLLEELENRINKISELDVDFIKDHFDWVDEEDVEDDTDDEQLVLEAAEILENFPQESINDQMKLEYIAKVFSKYILEQFETLLPE